MRRRDQLTCPLRQVAPRSPPAPGAFIRPGDDLAHGSVLVATSGDQEVIVLRGRRGWCGRRSRHLLQQGGAEERAHNGCSTLHRVWLGLARHGSSKTRARRDSTPWGRDSVGLRGSVGLTDLVASSRSVRTSPGCLQDTVPTGLTCISVLTSLSWTAVVRVTSPRALPPSSLRGGSVGDKAAPDRASEQCSASGPHSTDSPSNINLSHSVLFTPAAAASLILRRCAARGAARTPGATVHGVRKRRAVAGGLCGVGAGRGSADGRARGAAPSRAWLLRRRARIRR